jgi:ADP-ribose pyrophosphatase
MVNGGSRILRRVTDESHLHHHRVASRTVYAGRLMTVRFDDVTHADGTPGWREWVEHPGGVIVVPMLDARRVVMLRQFRYAPGRVFDELPAGLLDKPGEDAEAAAARELAEETGYTAQRFTFLGRYFSQSGFCTDSAAIYLAEQLTPGPRALEAQEHIDVHPRDLDTMIATLAGSDEQSDARTLLALMLADRALKNGR